MSTNPTTLPDKPSELKETLDKAHSLLLSYASSKEVPEDAEYFYCPKCERKSKSWPVKRHRDDCRLGNTIKRLAALLEEEGL